MTAKKEFDRVIAIDIGNSLTKIKSEYTDGSLYFLALPSSFASEHSIGMSFDGSGIDVDVYEVEGDKYVWGTDVAEISQTFETASTIENRYATSNYKTFTEIILARIARDIEIHPTEKILIVTEIPMGYLKPETIESLKGSFLGKGNKYPGLRKLIVNGEEYIINIADVKVIPQQIATKLANFGERGAIIDYGEC